MLTKEILLKNFSDEDAKEAIKVYENYSLAYEKDITIFILLHFIISFI